MRDKQRIDDFAPAASAAHTLGNRLKPASNYYTHYRFETIALDLVEHAVVHCVPWPRWPATSIFRYRSGTRGRLAHIHQDTRLAPRRDLRASDLRIRNCRIEVCGSRPSLEQLPSHPRPGARTCAGHTR